MDLGTIIDEIVKNKASEIEKEGITAVKSGNNGPYYNVETEVRNYAHWCVTFSEYYRTTRDDRYKKLTVMLADGILNSDTYNGNGVYRCREAGKGDEVNGVIGPAWIIEGLIYAARATGDDRYYNRALELFKVVPFNERLAIWQRKNTKNEVLSVDTTFNHQLWFAAAGSLITSYRDDSEIRRQLKKFISKMDKNITVRKNGRIAHFTYNDQNGMLGYLGRIIRDKKNDVLELIGKPSHAYKEAGYHAFNLYGFAILKENFDEEISFFKTKTFDKTLEYTLKQKYFDELCSCDRALDETRVKTKLNAPFNTYSFAYNSPAFELKRVYDCFNIPKDRYAKLYDAFCDKQIELTYDEGLKSFSKNTDDPQVLTTRIYEYVAGRR